MERGFPRPISTLSQVAQVDRRVDRRERIRSKHRIGQPEFGRPACERLVDAGSVQNETHLTAPHNGPDHI